MDLNPNSSPRPRRGSPATSRTHRANVLKDWRLEPGTYESAAMTNSSTLAGPMSAEGVAVEHARRDLVPAAPSSARHTRQG